MGKEGRALAAVSYWAYNDTQSGPRLLALRRVLLALAAFPVEVTVLLVSNAHVPEVADLVRRQAVFPRPACGPPKRGRKDWCLPWEAVRELARGPAPRNCSRAAGAYDFYLYLEGDIELPAETFERWRRSAPALHERGYLLGPHRREFALGREFLSDCLPPFCQAETLAFRDGKDVLLRPANPHAGLFVMSCPMFLEYLAGPQWQYGCAANVWGQGLRELAAAGLSAHPRYGRLATLTRVDLVVYHLVLRTGLYHRFDDRKRRKENASLLSAIADRCAADEARCPHLPVRAGAQPKGGGCFVDLGDVYDNAERPVSVGRAMEAHGFLQGAMRLYG